MWGPDRTGFVSSEEEEERDHRKAQRRTRVRTRAESSQGERPPQKPAPLTPGSGPSGLQNCENIASLAQGPSLRYFVRPARVDEDTAVVVFVL